MQLNYAKPKPKKRSALSRFPMWAVVVTGMFCCGRDFSYIGIAPLFIGEAYLGYSIFRNLRNWIGRFVNDIFRFRALQTMIALHLLWGIIEVIRASFMGRSLLEAIRTAAFNYYPLYLPIGLAIGATITYPLLIKVIKGMMIVFGFRSFATMVGIEYMSPANCAIVTSLALAAWDQLKGWKLRWPLLVISFYPIFFTGTHGRGTVLGLVAGAAAVAASSRKRLFYWVVGGGAATAVMFFVGPLIPGPAAGAPPLDPVVQLARIIASNHPNTAIQLIKWREGGRVTGGYKKELDNLVNARGTASWRQDIWRAAIKSLKTTKLQLLGQGEATSIKDLTPDGQDIHTPHNISIYCIYYTGYIGLTIFFLLLAAIWYAGTQLTHPVIRVIYSASFWCTFLVAITGNYLEAPFGAIPFYLFQGVLIGLDRKLLAEAKYARKIEAEMQRDDWAQPPAPRAGRFTTPFARQYAVR